MSSVIPSNPLGIALKEALGEAAYVEEMLSDTERKLSAATARATIAALNRKADDGKALYTNDIARKAAVDLAIADDPLCERLAKEADAFRRRKAQAFADAEGLKATIRLAFGGMIKGLNGFG